VDRPGIRVDMAGIASNVNVRSHVPSVGVIVVVMHRLEDVVEVSRAPIGSEHLFCFPARDFSNFSGMKFILDRAALDNGSIAVYRLALYRLWFAL
jgi:hypothetical protein